jgi:hypothetical protein
MVILISEQQIKKLKINEIDWKGEFEDVKTVCLSQEAIVDYLNQVRANASKDYGKRTKFDVKMPFIHSKSAFFKDNPDATIDVQAFIERITTPPKTIISQNSKMSKSGGKNQFVYNTGIPAFRGIVYDKEQDKFFVINTCPGAGSCVSICYARKGNYIQYSQAYDSFTRRLNLLLNDPTAYQTQLYNELKARATEHKALTGYKNEVVIRWNDSGDFFTKRYVQIAKDVIKDLQASGYNVIDYAYTKMADVAAAGDLGSTTFSMGANKEQTKKAQNISSQKLSLVIPKELMSGIEIHTYEGEDQYKQRVSDFFSIPVEELVTYDEFMSSPKMDYPFYNVIVTPNDGDDAAQRPDVKRILLSAH